MKPEFRDWYVKLGMRIAIVRRSKNLSQKELADLIGTEMQNISKYERAYSGIGMDRLFEIAAALSVPPCMLLDFSEIEAIEKESKS